MSVDQWSLISVRSVVTVVVCAQRTVLPDESVTSVGSDQQHSARYTRPLHTTPYKAQCGQLT